MENYFIELNNINVNGHTEKRKGSGSKELTYLSWAWAVAEILKRYPDMRYDIKKFADKDGVLRPYMYDENTGYMVETCVTIGDITRCMWLPVMDSANKAMKKEKYSYFVTDYYDKSKQIEKFVEPATMFDINKTLMRCLTKNLAMFGLGLYIYAGEDLPEEEKEPEPTPQEKAKATREANKKRIEDLIKTAEETIVKVESFDGEFDIKQVMFVDSLLKQLSLHKECGDVYDRLLNAYNKKHEDKITY